jgi:hypothetical protein
MSRRLKIEDIQKVLLNKFGGKVDILHYDGYESNKSIFKCYKHGVFKTSYTSMNNAKYPCKKCYREDLPNLSRKKDISKELDFVKKKFKGVYDFSKFKPLGMVDKSILICPKHGEFKKDLFHLYNRGCGCNKCGNIKIGEARKSNKKRFLSLYKKKWGNITGLENIVFKGWRNKVVFECKKHGNVLSSLNSLMASGGCTLCGSERRRKYMGRTRFNASCNRRSGIGYFYVFKVIGENEEFYKIGITSDYVHRFYDYSRKRTKYDFNLIHIEEGSPEEIYEKEIMCKSILKKHRHKPAHKFGGYTECFSNVEKLSKWL